MESIPLPKKIEIQPNKKDPNAGTVTISPLYPGYGPTVANSLRRVLLSSLPGAAIFAFKIKGVSHEFTSIDYVKEDVVDISLNLKQVNIKSHTDEVVKITLKAEGEKEITAADIEKNSDIEVVNPDQKIMTLTDKAASIEITLWVRTGLGYITVEARPEEELEVNAIAIDSIYTPIRQVGYQVDNVRVGDRTDFDKITMRVETNGGITVEEAIKESANILANHFKLISEFDKIGPDAEEEESSSANATADKAEDVSEENKEDQESEEKSE
ncbi:DNA-directed RNA polymerase subunit alpha [Patescibacteria group bacterium]|nr:DNA-directed RNA polymerase subunit alpha [Patescibacteria group bacterium]